MSGFKEHNPITHRIDTIRSLWTNAVNDEKVRIIRWRMKQDEVRMIEGWFKLESTTEGASPDVFLKFITPFNGFEKYSSDLLHELNERLTIDKEECAKAGINIPFEISPPGNNYYGKLSPKYFSDTIERFVGSLSEFKEKIIVWLHPYNKHEARAAFQAWLNEFAELAVFKRFRLMLVDTTTYPLYDAFISSRKNISVDLSPDLKMSDAAKQMASTGNPSAPDVQFRKYFMSMGEAAAKKNLDQMESWAGRAYKVAEKAGWNYLMATVHITTGSNYMAYKKYEMAVKKFTEALRISNETIEKGDDTTAPVLAIQSHSFLGAVFFLMKEYDKAIVHYDSMATKASVRKDYFNAMEGFRMKAFCEQKNKKNEEAWNSNWKAIDVSRFLDENSRKSSPLYMVGDSLITLAEKMGKKKDESNNINLAMTELSGPDWKERVKQLAVK